MTKLVFPNLLNARDLGDLPTRDGQRTHSKTFIRSDAVTRLTPEGWQALIAYGVQTVLDLRWAEEVAQHTYTPPSSMNYLHVSLLNTSEAEWRAGRTSVEKEFWSCRVIDDAQPWIAAAMRALATAPAGGVLFHCHSGKDRTGVLASLLLALAEVEPDAIAHDYALTTENLRDAYLAKYPNHAPEEVLEHVRCPPAQVHNMLAHLESAYGGIEKYFLGIGVSKADIENVKGRLR